MKLLTAFMLMINQNSSFFMGLFLLLFGFKQIFIAEANTIEMVHAWQYAILGFILFLQQDLVDIKKKLDKE